MNFQNSINDFNSNIINPIPDIENKQLAIAAFFNKNLETNSKRINVLFEDFIISKKFSQYCSEVKRNRNQLIYLTMAQIFASLIGMFFMVIRRSYIYLIVNMLTLILAFCGVFGAIRLHLIALIVHCIFTTSLTGGFFFYQFVDFFLSSDHYDTEKNRASDSVVLFIFSMPYVFDLICGLFCYYFLKKVARENTLIKGEHEKLREEIDEINSKVSHDMMQTIFRNSNQEICVICMNNKRNTVLNPCGHFLCCNECCAELFNKYIFAKPRCPICRNDCEGFVKMIVS